MGWDEGGYTGSRRSRPIVMGGLGPTTHAFPPSSFESHVPCVETFSHGVGPRGLYRVPQIAAHRHGRPCAGHPLQHRAATDGRHGGRP
jgi:hypothetical protein